MNRYCIDIQAKARFVLATVHGDFPGAEEARVQWQAVADAARAAGLDRVMFVRYGGRPPDAVGLVDTLRGFHSFGLQGWRIAIVFWDSERLVEDYQFVTALARHLGFELSVCATIADAEAFIERPSTGDGENVPAGFRPLTSDGADARSEAVAQWQPVPSPAKPSRH